MSRKERVCKERGRGEVTYCDEMQVFGGRKIETRKIDRVDRWNEFGDNEKVVTVQIMFVYRDEAVARLFQKMKKQCVSSVAVPHQP